MQRATKGLRISKPLNYETVLSLSLLVLVMMILASCASGGVSAECLAFKPIYFDAKDQLTRETEIAILSHDLTGESLCGWKPSK